MGFWSSSKKPQTDRTLDYSAGDKQVLRKRFRPSSNGVVLQSRTNGHPDPRSSTFHDTQSKHPDNDFRSQVQSGSNNFNSVNPASNVPRDGLWSWIPHVTQSADDSTIVDRVKDVFFYAEHIVDNFYTNHVGKRSVLDTDFDKINYSCLLSTTRLRTWLEESCHQTTLIKHTLISLVLELISFHSTTSSLSLLPEGFRNYAVIDQARRKSSLVGRERQYLQSALSSYRVLSAYICSDIENDEDYLRHQNNVVDQVSSDIDRSFHYWAKPETSSDDRRATLRKLLKKASSLGILLFAQPSIFQFDWTDVGRDPSSQTLPIWPQLLRVIDDEAQQRDVGDCMISMKHGIIFEERGGLPVEAVYSESQNPLHMQARTLPAKPIVPETTQSTLQDPDTSQSTSMPPLASTEGCGQFHAHELNRSGNLVSQADDLDMNSAEAVAPVKTIGRGSLDLSRAHQRLAIRSRTLLPPQNDTSTRNNMSYLNPASSRRSEAETQSAPQYNPKMISHKNQMWQTSDQRPQRVSSWPKPLSSHPTTDYDGYGPTESLSTSMPPPYEAELASMNVRSQQPEPVRGTAVSRSNSRRSMTISTSQPPPTPPDPYTTNNRTSLEQTSSVQYTAPFLRMPEPHISPPRDMQPDLTPINMPRKPLPVKHGSATSYPPTAHEKYWAGINADAHARYFADTAHDPSRQPSSRSRRRRSNSSPVEPSPSRSRSSSRNSFHGSRW